MLGTSETSTSVAGPDAEYADFLKQGKICVQRCDSCQVSIFPPRTICCSCGANNLTFRPVSGLGTVYSTTTVRARATEGGPYNLSLVDLDEGVRLMSHVEGVQCEQVFIGMRVRARIRTSGEMTPTLIFDPVEPE